jgi:hypothetical protein
VIEYIEGRIKVLLDLFPSIGKTAEKVAGAASGAYEKAKDIAHGIGTRVASVFSKPAPVATPATVGAQIAGHRAAGGPVQAGKSYLIGEKGPEVVNFGASGNVIPNSALAGAGNAGTGGNVDSSGLVALTRTLAAAVGTFTEAVSNFSGVAAAQAVESGINERGLRTAVESLDAHLNRNLVPALANLTSALSKVVKIFGDDEEEGKGGKGGGEGDGDDRGGREAPTPALPAKEQRQRMDEDVQKLQDKGWTREQAIGIVANLQAESGMNEKNVGDGGQAFGLAQWHPDRQAAFKKQFGKDIRQSTHDEQLAFVDWELRHGGPQERAAGRKLAEAKDAGTAAAIVSKGYERPAAVEEAASNRAALARLLAKAPPGVLNLTQGAPANAVQSYANDNRQTNTNTSNNSTSINIGTITTQATDAKGLANDLGPALDRFGTAGDANFGIA